MSNCGQRSPETSAWEELLEFYQYFSEIYDISELFDIFAEEKEISEGEIHPVLEALGSDAILLDLLEHRPDLVCTNPAHPVLFNRITVGVSTLRDSAITRFNGALRFESHTALVEYGRVRHRKTLDAEKIIGAEEVPEDYRWFIDSLATLPIPLFKRYLSEFSGKSPESQQKVDMLAMMQSAAMYDEGISKFIEPAVGELASIIQHGTTSTAAIEEFFDNAIPSTVGHQTTASYIVQRAQVASAARAPGSSQVPEPTEDWYDELESIIIGEYNIQNPHAEQVSTPTDPRIREFTRRYLSDSDILAEVVESISEGLPENASLSLRDISEALGSTISDTSSQEEIDMMTAAFR